MELLHHKGTVPASCSLPTPTACGLYKWIYGVAALAAYLLYTLAIYLAIGANSPLSPSGVAH
jgi:hypothetical protein